MTTFLYDFRNRRTATDGEIDFYETVIYDNLSRVVSTDRRNTTNVGNLIARSEVRFDDRGRVYQSIRYAVDPATGTVGAALTDNMWFDAAGNVIKSQPAGSKGFTKTSYDGLGRTLATYVGYDLSDTTYADATTITGDTIFQQSEKPMTPPAMSFKRRAEIAITARPVRGRSERRAVPNPKPA